MPVPGFTIDGVLPPFIGPDGPGGATSDMSPYAVTALEVVSALGTTPHRRSILRRWIEHRTQLRAVAVDRGFQWLDGSFVEDKVPSDLDLITYFHRPANAQDSAQLNTFLHINAHLFRRGPVKAAFNLDAFFVDLNSQPEQIVSYSRYLLGLFSHRRGDSLWKGMLEVRLEDALDDEGALIEMDQLDAISAAGGHP
jgi:hypothetical protein